MTRRKGQRVKAEVVRNLAELPPVKRVGKVAGVQNQVLVNRMPGIQNGWSI